MGDNNDELINTYRTIRDHPDEIHRRLVRIERNADSYYYWRSLNPRELDDRIRALRFIYLNHNCFNGIYRTNAVGDFNVPFGSKLSRNLTRDEFVQCARTLEVADLVSADFQVVLSQVRRGDFVYMDPPYAVTTRRVFREYGSKPFGPDDIDRLSNELRRIAALGADFLVSYADCREARAIASEWDARRILVKRHVAGFANHRGHVYEWLISNQPAIAAL